MKRKIIGVLGLGSVSTLFYIKELNANYHSIHAGYSTCPFKLLNTNFNEINNLLPKHSTELQRLVEKPINELLKLEVDLLVVPNITLHETIDKLKLSTEIAHPIHCTLSHLRKKECNEVMLFGSYFTMQESYIKHHFLENDINVLLPSKKDQLFIDEIRKQIYNETVPFEILKKFNKLINKHTANIPVVLACTELSVAFTNKNSQVFDMARIQIKVAFKSTQVY